MNRSRDFLVGIVFFGLLFVLGGFTIFLADFRLGAAETMTVSFERVEGLAVGANVWINGVKSGRVDAVRRDPQTDRVLVGLKFDGEPGLREGATFRVDSLSLLGGKVVSISNGTGGPLDLAADHQGAVLANPLAQVQAVANRIDRLIAANEENIAATIANLARATQDAQELIADNRASLKDAIRAMAVFTKSLEVKGPGLVEDLAAIADRVEKGEGSIGMLLSDDSLARDLTAAVQQISAAAGRLDRGEGTLGRLLTDDTLARSLEAAAADVRAFTGDMRSGEGSLGLLIRDRALYDDARATLENLNAATARIDAALGANNQNSVIGLLLNDPQMAEDLKRSVKALSDFLESQRENAPLTTFAGLLFKPF